MNEEPSVDDSMGSEHTIINLDEPILVTGASGFIGSRVVEKLLSHGFCNLRCFTRPTSDLEKIEVMRRRYLGGARIEVIQGNLLSSDDCWNATKDVLVIYHLASGRGEKSFPDAFINSVVTTRNLLEAARRHRILRRFVSISSFSVYSNRNNPQGRLLDESSPIEDRPHLRGDAYTFAKAKQDEIVAEYGKKFGIPYVIIRPGVVYGPGNEAITGRAGIGTFGMFLHLGGGNRIPFTYVDNCAEAIVLAGMKRGVDGEIFNVVDDDLPSSRRFLRLYKKHVRNFRSAYIPHGVSYLLCWFWEKYSEWSEGQLPPAFNRRVWHAYWKRTCYSNEKLKNRLGWRPSVSPTEAFSTYFESCKQNMRHV